jgi:hypothetical protein
MQVTGQNKFSYFDVLIKVVNNEIVSQVSDFATLILTKLAVYELAGSVEWCEKHA